MKNIKKKKSANKKSKIIFEGGALLCSALGSLSSLAILTVLLMIFAGVCLALDNAHTALTPFALFSLYTSAFFGGFVAVKKNKGRDALLCSSLCGVFTTLIFCLVFWIVGLIFDIKSDMLSWVFRALCIISSIIGGFIGRGSQKKPKRKRRR
jgi:putative membrane protein (TIGR04086 family)